VLLVVAATAAWSTQPEESKFGVNAFAPTSVRTTTLSRLQAVSTTRRRNEPPVVVQPEFDVLETLWVGPIDKIDNDNSNGLWNPSNKEKGSLDEEQDGVVTAEACLDVDDDQELSKSQLPPWLQRYYQKDQVLLAEEEEGASSSTGSFPTKELQALQTTLARNGFSPHDVHEVLETMAFYCAASGEESSSAATAATAKTTTNNNNHKPVEFATTVDTSLLLGMIDFVQLILAEQNHFEEHCDKVDVVHEDTTNAVDPSTTTGPTKKNMHRDVFASKPVILAGIVYYAECVAARQEGIYDWFAVGQSLQRLSSSQAKRPAFAPSSSAAAAISGGAVDTTTKSQDDTSLATTDSSSSSLTPPLPATAQQIASSAATIKRAEILAATIMGVGSSRRLSQTEADGLRGLLLSSMDDWRALALRCIASLFRLENILAQQQSQQHADAGTYSPLLLPGLRSPEVVHTAQEAIMVYATLAQRLGMHQLKAKIEERAFRILYQRQYRAVSSVYQQNEGAMYAIRGYLVQRIDALLRSDDSLMAHIEDIQISSRVKEPYSFWRKCSKQRPNNARQRPRRQCHRRCLGCQRNHRRPLRPCTRPHRRLHQQRTAATSAPLRHRICPWTKSRMELLCGSF